MKPEIWSELPFDLLEHIAKFCDIDSRRALGFKPHPLPPLIFPSFRPSLQRVFSPGNIGDMFAEVFNYISETKTLVFFENHKYGKYFWRLPKMSNMTQRQICFDMTNHCTTEKFEATNNVNDTCWFL
jgi:hypothetical protein